MNERLDFLYDNYLKKVDYLEKNRKLGEGIFGMKGGPSDDPCHERFAEELSEYLHALTEPAEIRDALETVYFTPKQHAGLKTAYWMLLAVHSVTLDLIERLPGKDAGELLERYGKEYPRRERFPVQKRVLAELKKQSVK